MMQMKWKLFVFKTDRSISEKGTSYLFQNGMFQNIFYRCARKLFCCYMSLVWYFSRSKAILVHYFAFHWKCLAFLNSNHIQCSESLKFSTLPKKCRTSIFNGTSDQGYTAEVPSGMVYFVSTHCRNRWNKIRVKREHKTLILQFKKVQCLCESVYKILMSVSEECISMKK